MALKNRVLPALVALCRSDACRHAGECVLAEYEKRLPH